MSFIKKNWLILITILSLTLNIIAAYFLYQDSKIIEETHGKTLIKQEPLDYEKFQDEWGDAWIGLEVTYVTPEDAARVMIDKVEGALVTKIYNNSPAQKAGIVAGNVILSLNGRKIREPQQLQSDLAGTEVGEEVYMCVANEDNRSTVYVVPVEWPSYLSHQTTVFPWFGATVSDVAFGSSDAEKIEDAGKEGGILVEAVHPNSPAEKAGLLKDDIIMSFNNRKTRTLREFLSDLAGMSPGQQVAMCIIRDDVRKTLYVTLENKLTSQEI